MTEINTLQFITSRLILRPFCDEDLEPFLAYRSDPEIAKYQGWEVPYQRDMAVDFIREMKDRQPNTPDKWYQMAVVLKSSGAMVGDLAYYLLKKDTRQAEIGITLAKAYHGFGYAEEAARCLLDYLFGELKLHRVIANCDVENPAAWKTLEKLGFRREAHFIENLWFRGRWTSEYWYALLDREF